MQLLTFLLNGVKFGIPVNDVESIETRMNVVNIPNSLPQVHGIMNLHGEVIAVYSLAEQFHYPEQEINNIIVASMNGTKIGLEVGNVDEIIDCHLEDILNTLGRHYNVEIKAEPHLYTNDLYTIKLRKGEPLQAAIHIVTMTVGGMESKVTDNKVVILTAASPANKSKKGGTHP